MTKRMLIDASHPEETRVVVLDGNRLEDFDLETQNRRPLKGNIYLAKIVRVEPSLQAAFVEYGGNRHGFLAFGEIHPDYYQIPVADRQRILEAQAAEAEDEDPEDEIETAAERVAPEDDADLAARGGDGETLDETGAVAPAPRETPAPSGDAEAPDAAETAPSDVEPPTGDAPAPGETAGSEDGAPSPAPRARPMAMHVDRVTEGDMPTDPLTSLPVGLPVGLPVDLPVGDAAGIGADPDAREAEPAPGIERGVETVTEDAPPPETVGGGRDDASDADEEGGEEERRERRIPSRHLRHYKIQEVMRRRQIILVQVVKEERGNKGAALTTYVSLPGRFSVLMPNSPKGGGVSRKISSASDRKRLREVIDEVGLPRGMGIIVRTAGAQRPKPEIRRDCEYLLSLWDSIRERTLKSTAPALVYEEADLLKRSLRDNFSKDIEEIQIEGDDAFRQARDFTRALMPQNERKIRLYREPGMPLFARAGVEQQLDAMMQPTVGLRSGGYIVINQTEALVSIDVNSGRATRDRHIEDTALRTNLEAADEIARQLRLRDLAGLIVIDFIDMESGRNDAMVERRIKEALQQDRARIQVGRISHFGLLEMSRQRLRPSLTEHSFVTCPHCQGLGIVRSDESSALHVLRAIEEEGAKRRAAEILVHCSPAVAMHILNRKRERLAATEARHDMCVVFEPDATLTAAANRIDRVRPQLRDAPPPSAAPALRMDYAPEPVFVTGGGGDDEDEEPVGVAGEAGSALSAGPEADAEGNGAEGTGAEGTGDRGRRRRRRRRGGRREDGAPSEAGPGESEDAAEGAEAAAPPVEAAREAVEPAAPGTAPSPGEAPSEGPAGERPDGDGRRRRGRRGGSRFRRDAEAPQEDAPVAETPRYLGPTPAEPFAGISDALMDAMDAVDEAAAPRSVREIPITPPGGATAGLSQDVAPEEVVSGEAPAEAAARSEPVPEPVATAAPVPAAPTDAPVADATSAASEPPAPEPVAPQPVASEPVASEPVASGPVASEPAGSEPGAEAGRAGPVVGAAVRPVLLGSEDAAAPAKKGWWRR